MKSSPSYIVLPFVFGGRSCYRYQVFREGVVVAEGYADTEEAATKLAKRIAEEK